MYHNIYMVSAEDVQRKALFIIFFVRRAIVPLFLICIDVTYILLNILVRLLLVVAHSVLTPFSSLSCYCVCPFTAKPWFLSH